MEEKELKTCPFCGKKVELSHDGLRQNRGANYYTTKWKIYCPECKTAMMKEDAYYEFGDDGIFKALDDGRAALVKRWNTRH